MGHPDQSWRVAAIYRCCVRFGKSQQWATQELTKLHTLSADGKVIAGHSFPRLADIWFRRLTPASPNHIEQARHLYRQREITP